MAIAAAALEGGEAAGAGEAAGGEGLSSQAKTAVSQAAAGHGRKLTPEVKTELRRAATNAKAAATSKKSPVKQPFAPLPSPSDVGNLPSQLASGAGRAASMASTRGGRSNLAFRVVLAFGAFLLALEVASYLSGRYFSYSLGKGGQKLAGAAQHLDLYPGQSAKLALQKTLPPPSALPGYP